MGKTPWNPPLLENHFVCGLSRSLEKNQGSAFSLEKEKSSRIERLLWFCQSRLFIFAVDFCQAEDAEEQDEQKPIEQGLAAGKYHIQDAFADKDSANQKMHPSDGFQIGRKVFLLNIFQAAFGIEGRLTINSENTSGKKINANKKK